MFVITAVLLEVVTTLVMRLLEETASGSAIMPFSLWVGTAPCSGTWGEVCCTCQHLCRMWEPRRWWQVVKEVLSTVDNIKQKLSADSQHMWVRVLVDPLWTSQVWRCTCYHICLWICPCNRPRIFVIYFCGFLARNFGNLSCISVDF